MSANSKFFSTSRKFWLTTLRNNHRKTKGLEIRLWRLRWAKTSSLKKAWLTKQIYKMITTILKILRTSSKMMREKMLKERTNWAKLKWSCSASKKSATPKNEPFRIGTCPVLQVKKAAGQPSSKSSSTIKFPAESPKRRGYRWRLLSCCPGFDSSLEMLQNDYCFQSPVRIIWNTVHGKLHKI